MTSAYHDLPIGSPAALAGELSIEIERAILQLVVDGFERWQSGGFERAGNYENHLTVRLVACMNEIRRERNLSLVPRYQFVEPTDEMLAGRADPDRAPCIDIVVSWGFLTEDAYVSIECKRLAPDLLARLYVVRGIDRFVRGYYGSKARVGGMVGYVIRGTPGEVIQRVNAHVAANPTMGPTHTLMPAEAVGPLNTVFESNHERPSPFQRIRLTHLIFDVSMIGLET